MTDKTRQKRADLVRANERKTREVVEAEQLLVRLRVEQAALRDQLLDAVRGRVKRPEIPESTLATARAVAEAGAPMSRQQVAIALGINKGAAGVRLRRALVAGLVARVGRDQYVSPANTPTAREAPATT